ncbi:MAG: ABC transporter substrate-binding protein [Arenicella sp.]
MKYFFNVIIFVLISSLLAESAFAKTLNIAFLNGRTNQGFWKNVEDFMVEVSQDFDDVELTIYRAESNHFTQLKILEEITAPGYKTKYDAVLTRTLKKNGIKLLEIAEKNKTPLFLFNSGLEADQIAEVGGGPRKNYKYYIGEMYPDDVAAGYDSAKELYRVAQKHNISSNKKADGRLGVLAFDGGHTNSASINRVKGLKKFAAEKSVSLKILQIIPVNSLNDGGYKESKAKMGRIQGVRYGKINLVWAYNDSVSVGAIESGTEKLADLSAGTTFFSGGIDWTPRAINLVDDGQMAYTLGGHYMDGGWSFLAVYDYLNGKDFAATEGLMTFNTRLSVINKDNVLGYKRLFVDNQLSKIDFKNISKFKNSNLETYNFGLGLLLGQLQ